MNGGNVPGDVADLDLRDEEPPPILGAWRVLYALVIAALVLDMVLLALLTRTFS